MTCADCEGRTLSLAVPESYREFADDATVTVCRTCLTVTSGGDGTDEPDDVADAIPGGDPGVGVCLLCGLLESVATNRAAIEGLVARMERDGVDVLLVLDRIAADPDLDPAIDVARRRRVVEQLA
ncbi:hypothetical protein BRD17_08400 [Halobacteriales archaeon SW_7_68_16]|nr:MAG: hypothetical protein BRD17_08400 [Halobacteriales archaeon SW_7_68_16]